MNKKREEQRKAFFEKVETLSPGMDKLFVKMMLENLGCAYTNVEDLKKHCEDCLQCIQIEFQELYTLLQFLFEDEKKE